MKKLVLSLFTLITAGTLLFGCTAEKIETPSTEVFQGTVSALSDKTVTVDISDGYAIRRSSDKVVFGTAGLEAIGADVGDTVEVMFDGSVAESYPAQITALYWRLIEKKADEPQSEIPASVGRNEALGLALSLKDVTEKGAILVFEQSGGEPAGELTTGSFFMLEKAEDDGSFKELPYIIEGDIAWTSEAWLIPMSGAVEWDVDWSYLYGSVTEAGSYRIGKQVMDFRGAGDYDISILYAEFEIPADE